ncbi:hypothetical protein RFI_09615 [Reticulomyxa filosa]|uniref:Uncharacterized protein n=1 Tax=Reticulomyxa filosa TaxID=46433 RepID=X6NMN5_RETFI|nr:hypothetical protein RFI_09615 [Reticulomyxa filosa]|eukprot:ETO27520.1 hypothetical protein RFI_09615 [Reticulomyxa filosa]
MSKLLRGWFPGSYSNVNAQSAQQANTFQESETTLKFVMLGDHKSGKTAISRVLHKKPYPEEYIPTIGIDTYKMRLEVTGLSSESFGSSREMAQSSQGSRKLWLWLWDEVKTTKYLSIYFKHIYTSVRKLQSKKFFLQKKKKKKIWMERYFAYVHICVHEALIYHEAHAIIVVCDLNSFASIEAVDRWLASLATYLRGSLESSEENGESTMDNEDEVGREDSSDSKKSQTKPSRPPGNSVNVAGKSNSSSPRKPPPPPNASPKRKWYHVPRVYLLLSKNDLSDEPILNDIEIGKFCRANGISGFAKISAKNDKRADILSVFHCFASDTFKRLPRHTFNEMFQQVICFQAKLF